LHALNACFQNRDEEGLGAAIGRRGVPPAMRAALRSSDDGAASTRIARVIALLRGQVDVAVKAFVPLSTWR